MELNNFGAIMKFAIDRENELLKLLGDDEQKKRCQKNIKLLERTRRENINETVLQPITGLDEKNYNINNLSKFYNDAADRLPVDEAKRVFNQLAKRHSERSEESRA